MDIVFLTGNRMNKPDYETHFIIEALSEKGIKSKVIPWKANENWEKVKLVVIRTTWDYHDDLHGFFSKIEYISKKTKVINSLEIIKWNSHKKYLNELTNSGVKAVPTILLDKGKIISQTDLLDTNFDKIVVKPAVSLGAEGAIKTTTSSKEALIHTNNLLKTGDVLIQPFLNEIYSGESSLLFFNQIFSHAVMKIPKKGEYRVQDNYGGSVKPYIPSTKEIEMAENAIKLAPNKLWYARVDFAMYNNEPHIMELELIEPDIFVRYSDACIDNFIGMLSQLL